MKMTITLFGDRYRRQPVEDATCEGCAFKQDLRRCIASGGACMRDVDGNMAVLVMERSHIGQGEQR